jgi:hypothetical protein
MLTKSEERFEVAHSKLMIAVSDLATQLSKNYRIELTDEENKFLDAFGEYLKALEDLDED